jgi:leucyl aminopeptidase (aminopeptidase T)
MNRSLRLIALVLGVLTIGMLAGFGDQWTRTTTPKMKNIAKRIVRDSAQIRFDELVLIKGTPHDQPLCEDLAIEVRKLGAHPLIVIGSDELSRRMFTDVPERFDVQEPMFAMKLADVADATIAIDRGEDPDLLSDISVERRATQMKATEPVYQRMLDRNVVQVELGNALYPTDALAKQFDMPKERLSEIFFNALGTDYKTLAKTGEAVQEKLVAGRTVRITAENGTDLTFRINERPVFVFDGVISPEERYAGGPACQAWLPAGEVAVSAVPGTAEGTFVAENFFYEGKLIRNLQLTFRSGKLIKMDGEGDLTAMKELYEAAPEGRDLFAGVDIGINPNVKAPPKTHFVSWIGEGTITVGFGRNDWLGGENKVPFALYAHLLDGTLTIDRKPLIRNGRLVLE